MSEKESTDSRRKLLKFIAVGSGVVVAGKSLSGNWTKLIVDTVVLPAHAESTPIPPEVDACDQGWVRGDGNGREEAIGKASTRCKCEELVKRKQPTADGATWTTGGDGTCYGEFNWASPDPSYITKRLSARDCNAGWIDGDGNGDSEQQIGNTISRCACDQFVRSQRPVATGATWSPDDKYCYAEFGWTDTLYYTKSFK